MENSEILGFLARSDGSGGTDKKSLASPSGFPWLTFERAENHLYNLRHLAHHTGQLSAVLCKHGKKWPWVKTERRAE